MNRVEIKQLPNDVKLSAYFNSSPKKSIQRIEALKPVYTEQVGVGGIKEKQLLLVMEKSHRENSTFKEQLLFDGKSLDTIEHYMYAYIPQKFDVVAGQCLKYEWSRIEDNPTLAQVWENPINYKKLEIFTKLFLGFGKENPVKYSQNDDLFTQVNAEKNELDTFLKIAKDDEKMGKMQEYCGYNKLYIKSFIKNCR